MVTEYIWKDTAYTTSADTLDWKVEYKGTELVSGVSIKRPGEEYVHVYVNRLVEDILKSSYPQATGVTTDTGAYGDFVLKDSSGTTLETYRFILGSDGNVKTGIANEPVNGHADVRQRLFVGGWFPTAKNVTIQGQ